MLLFNVLVIMSIKIAEKTVTKAAFFFFNITRSIKTGINRYAVPPCVMYLKKTSQNGLLNLFTAIAISGLENSNNKTTEIPENRAVKVKKYFPFWCSNFLLQINRKLF